MTLHEFMSNSPTAVIASVFVLGAMVGSFLNVVIHRLPVMLEKDWKQQCDELFSASATTEVTQDQATKNPSTSKQKYNLISPGSHCPNCSHKISALENIPIISYLFLKGQCSDCKQSISLRYPLIELVTAIMSAVVAIYFGYTWALAAGLILTWSLICLCMIDFDTQYLPDVITIPLLWAGLLFSLLPDTTANTIMISPSHSIIGAALGYMILWLVFHTFKLITGKEGMGYGDFKLYAALGAWMGWHLLPLIIILSSFVGAIVGIGLIIFKGRDKNTPIPFGPYLAAAGWIALIWGKDIINFYSKNLL